MTRTLPVAACQLRAHDRFTLEGVWPRIAGRIREAARDGAKLVVLPEGTLPSYVMGYRPYDPAETAAALDECRQLARELGVVIVVGAARREADRTFNSAIAIDADGTVAGHADKHFLWHFDRQWFAPGERIEPVSTSIGTLGILVCADGRIPLIASTLVDRGAEILVMPTAWVTSGRDPANLENVQADLLARIRARENGVPFIGANKCGVEMGCVAYCGKTQIVARDGSPAAMASQDREETIMAHVELGGPAPVRSSANATSTTIGTGNGAARSPVRVAVAARDFSDEAFMDERLRVLEAGLLVMPESTYPSAGNVEAPLIFAGDPIVLDPAGLAARRLAGIDLAVWRTSIEEPWQTAFARARALELRMYIVVVDAPARAFAVDPDGAIVCGTFDEYEIASFTYDPARAQQTLVAPGTDVRAGLERAHRHAHR